MVWSVEKGTDVEGRKQRPVTVVPHHRETTSVPATIRVPLSADGVATAITHAAAACDTTTPARSDPSNRVHPPLLTFGERRIPSALADRTPETGIHLQVPADYGDLFAAAPLAYYLGATVTADGSATSARLTTPDGVEHSLSTGAPLATETSRLLRSVFFLDCLARGPAEVEPPVGRDVDLDAYGGRPMAGRLATVLDGALNGLEDRLPDWHLSTYVEADPYNARALPYLLDAMSLVYPPSSSELDGKGLLKRSLDDFFRGEVATANRLDPDLRASHAHAWLAEGIPITASKTTVRAYENRLRHRSRTGEGLRIDVVINDREMHAEAGVADIYRELETALPVTVEVHESLSRGGLRNVFESRTDFVHYVGHCEVEGLRCSDGHLPAESVDVGTRTFFLNACGSYAEGLALVEGGAVAGGVTLTRVLDEQAATVGTGFARLLVHGVGFERALSLARRQIMMGTDYAVVGDGTYALTSPRGDPAVCHVSGGPDRFDVRWEVVDARSAGRTYDAPFDGGRRPYGTPTESCLSAAELRAFLAETDLPVVFEGTVRPASELVAELPDR